MRAVRAGGTPAEFRARSSRRGRWPSRRCCSTSPRLPASASARRRDSLAGQGIPSGAGRQPLLRPVSRLYCALKSVLESAVTQAVRILATMIAARKSGGTCPRDGAPMVYGTVGGRSTWWCSREQVLRPDHRSPAPNAAGSSRREARITSRSSALDDLPGRGIRARPQRTKAEMQEVRTPALAREREWITRRSSR